MPAINLPTIDISEKDFKSKETMDQILDTLQKYRKELNFLLMNLDIDNMPSISNVMSDMQGNISSITQTANGLSSTVSSLSTTVGGHSSSINQLSNEISSIVSFEDVTGNMIASRINQTATTVSISASKIDLTGVTTLYSQTSGRYARYNALGDFVLYESNSEIFSVYNTFGGGVALTFFGDSFIAYHDVTELIYPQGTWDFSDVEVTGLFLKWA